MKKTIVILIMLLVWGCNSQETNNLEDYSLKFIDDLHERLTMKDYDKSLLEFINSSPNAVDSIRKVVYLLPFGNMKPEVEKLIQSEIEYLKAFLQLEVKILDKISYDSIKEMSSIKTRMVSGSDFEYYSKIKGGIAPLKEQIHANSFMETVIKNNKPKDAISVLGITEHDIYNPKYNFLFGVSKLNDGIGLVSTFRIIDYGNETKYNIRKVVSKQIVNMFSISNVKDFKCVTNFHSDIYELHQGPFDLSPRALEKLKFAIGFDHSKRFEDLADFWTKENNKNEVEYYEECLRRTLKIRH